MASSKGTMNKCATFCLSHYVEHGQALNNKLDSIAEQRDIFRSRMAELPVILTKQYLTTINDWEKSMLQTVIETAENTRQQVHQLIVAEMERECDELTRKITSFRENDNYFETDLTELETG
ncbi:hypothetical protein I4U23_003719 [Adineta vaga]|nr:hypothetical protein I4U23_003719 [Adineta vaga]